MSVVRTTGACERSILQIPITYRRAGTEQIMLDLLRACAVDGWDTAAVVPPGLALDGFAHEIETVGTTVTRIGPLFEHERSPARNLIDLVRLMRRFRPTIVHLHYPWAPTCFEAIIACCLARVPYVVRTEHNPIREPLGRKQIWKLKVLDRMVDAIVCVSSSNRDDHVRNGHRRGTQIELIPNGVEPSPPTDCSRSKVRTELGIDGSTVAAVMIGALEERKGVMDLVRVAAVVGDDVDVNFFVIGDGEMRNAAEGLARELGVEERFRFLGQRNDVRDLLASFDIFVQPSHHEGMSLAMLEALEAGLPMVTTSVAGVDDVLPEEGGAIVCEVGDHRAVAEGVIALAESASLRRQLSAVSSARVRTAFTRSRMTADYLDLYGRFPALSSHPTP